MLLPRFRAGEVLETLERTGAQRTFLVLTMMAAQTYGQAEAPVTITHLHPDEHHKVGSAGRPYAMTAVRVGDGDDRDVPVGETGKVVCRGAIVSSGYWQRPDATAETFRGGWLHTGDHFALQRRQRPSRDLLG